MTHSRPMTFIASAAVIPLAGLAGAACGGGAAPTAAQPSAASTTTTMTTPTRAPTRTAAVRVAKSSLGSILVNSTGRTLYLFKADSRTKSACTGACATAWPPLLAEGKPIAGTGLTASKLGTITRASGSRQVTYNGHPLYLFVKDTKPGQTNGQGVTAFGAAWFAVSPAGNQISSHHAGHGSASSSRPAAPAAPPAAKPQPAPKPVPQPAPKPAPPVAKPAPPVSNSIPQNNGGDGDSDNNGGPSDGDGNV
jgi:predicted lipoprotein with Yx(FWY)xxD motif